MTNHANMKLGRSPARFDARTLRMARYFTAELPAPPASCDWTKAVADFGMMLNDTLGDCTIAGCGHAIQIWSLNSAAEITVADADILAAYEAWDGYVDGDASTDNGGVELDVLNAWRKGGLAGNALIGYADPNVANLDEVKQAIALFGGVYIGVNLPLTAQTQDVWDAVPDDGSGSSASGSWGGHCVFVAAYDAIGLTCITWGAPKKMTWAFWTAYVDEAHCLLSPDWISSQGAPSSLDLDQLTADLSAIT